MEMLDSPIGAESKRLMKKSSERKALMFCYFHSLFAHHFHLHCTIYDQSKDATALMGVVSFRQGHRHHPPQLSTATKEIMSLYFLMPHHF